jgi:prepilin signal peptidase PulO-like enzyme (type II secretory pathway)
MLRWAELKIGFGYFVFFSGILVTISVVLRGVTLPANATFFLCLIGLMASALGFGQLAPKDAILGAALGYIIPFIYNRTNIKVNPHLENIPEAYLLFYASIGAWLGPIVVFEMLLCAVATLLIFRAMFKPLLLTFEYQLAIVALASFARIVLG